MTREGTFALTDLVYNVTRELRDRVWDLSIVSIQYDELLT
jgi:hypothetical protein